MTGTVFRVSWLSLARDRVALALTFVLPLAFFSVFAAVFGAMDRDRRIPVRAAVVVEDLGDLGGRLVRFIEAEGVLSLEATAAASSRQDAEDAVRSGRVSVALVVGPSFTRAFEDGDAGASPVELLVDASHPIAADVARASLQSAAVRLGLQVLVEQDALREDATLLAADGAPLLDVAVVDLLGGGAKQPSVSFFAAGIGVMFLLFSVSGRSAILIEERESGVLERLLASRLGLTRLLAGRWLFLVTVGVAQVTLMFVWASIGFGLALFTVRHLAGFVVMTVVTSAAAAGFGLLLASLCRSRARLNGVAVVVVLVMSALGGSTFPRFLMPEGLRALGLLTFNAWALDGYQKVFWYEAPVTALWPQLAVLAALAAAFFAAARWAAGRWLDA